MRAAPRTIVRGTLTHYHAATGTTTIHHYPPLTRLERVVTALRIPLRVWDRWRGRLRFGV